ncbi:MAG: hypothetical protein WDN69_00390 [Aliidongia sp.]
MKAELDLKTNHGEISRQPMLWSPSCGMPMRSNRTRRQEIVMRDLLLRILTYPRPFRFALTRRTVPLLFSYQDRLALGEIDRPHYGYCIFQAARLAELLGYPKISVIEFGCGGGRIA